MKQSLLNTAVAFKIIIIIIIIIFTVLQQVILDILSQSELGDGYKT